MANNQRFSITFDASLNVGQIKGALGDIQKGLNSLHLPQNATKGLQGTFSKLSEEIQKFEVAAGKEIGSKADFSKLEKSAAKIGDLFGTLKRQVSELTGLKGKALEKIFPENISRNITQASKSLNNYKTAFKNAQNDIDKATSSVEKFNKSLEREKGKKVVTSDAFKKIEQDSKQAQIDVDTLTQKLQTLQEQHKTLGSSLTSPNKSSVYRKQTEDIKNLTAELEKAKQKATALSQQKANTTTFDKQAKKVAELTANLTDAQAKLAQFQQIFNQLQNPQGGDLSKLIEEVGRLTGLDMSKFKADAEGVGQAIETYIVQETQKMSQGLDKMGASVDDAGTHVQNLGKQMQDVGREIADADSRMREVDALKSRIQYFFGLNNTIELVKRTIRSAFETVKELDAAMTETAVVTDFSVADMWAQLPDYTKRANDLGVTTKAAYEAATLYYQQGLKTNEVTAMSNETLKMARIAGLDAAVATDRMTNAIRGFNMEINETNAQRIDDVYSKLAAISASNVDEISTAMTKVASLASSANMEFETTSAFLAQIIETTRESAETAGTALKTVVARFSEVKKLVSEDQLKGQDEEGQLIDVNKVSQALRTAGVDLNKYFLGEVGLDDIFMELASKWDSLTTLQQRYIATQAAGSRQQSRFLALMSDYGRMQELVGEAYNANGAAAEQFAKTQDSLESKLARLKNAWNEFAMGIANSDLVKAGVDFLTLLLNGVNKLTDGFGLLTGSVGGFVSSILKLGLLIGSLKLGKGLLAGGIGGIGGLLRGENFAEAAMKTMGNFGKGKGLFSMLFGGLGKTATRTAAASATEALIPSAGAGTLMTVGGASTLAATIGTITAAAGAAYVVLKQLYDLSPAGQVKIAEKYAAAISKVADEAKKTETSLKEAQTKYKEYSQAVSNSQNVQDHSKAIQDRNEYLTSLLEEDASFAQYLQSEVKNGEFVLTINEDTFANAIAKAEEATRSTKASDLLAQSNLAAQNADLARARQDTEENIIDEAGRIVATRQTTQSLKYQAQAQASDFESKALAKQAAIEMLGGVNLGDELTEALVNSYSTSFDANQYQKDITYNDFLGIGKFFANLTGSLDRQYEAIYGIGTADGLTRQEKAAGIKASEGQANQQQIIDNLVKLLQDQDRDTYAGILKAYAGDFSDFASLINQGDFTFGFNDEALSKVAEAYHIDVEKLTEQIQNYAQTERERQLQTRDTGYYSLAKGGTSQLDIARYLTLDNFEDMELISGLAQKFESSGVGGEIAHSILDQIESGTFEDSALQKWLQTLNFDNPIAGAKALHDGLQSINPQVRELAEAIQADDEAMSQFSASAQLGYLMTSESAEQLSESLGDFIEENGSINSSNIKELAASSADLNTLLETGAFTAKGLAVALNGISTGAFNFYDLNDAIIAAFNSMDDLDGIVSETIDDLNNFDPGYDENDITGFISQVYDNAKENFDKGAYGNNQMANYMREVFGAFNQPEGQDYGESYIAWLQENMAWLEANKENMYSAWSDVAASWQNGQQGLADIIDTGSEIIIELNGQNTQELIKSLQESTDLTDTQIRMLIADYKNYSADFAHELAVNDSSKAIDAFMAENRKHIGEQALYTEQELDTLAKGLGLSIADIKKQIVEKSGGAKSGKFQFLDIDTKDINSVKAALKKVTNIVGDYASSDGLINATNLKKGMGILGIDEEFESTLNQLVGNAKEFKWDFGGDIGIKKVAIEEGQSAGEALAQAMESAAQEQFGANFFAGVVAAAAENKIDIEAIDIPLNIKTDDVESELSTIIDKQKTIRNTKATASVGVSGATTAKSQIDNLQAALNRLKGTRRTTISITASGAGGLIVDKPGKRNLGERAANSQTGSQVRAKAKGGHTAPGVALTGEEDPEIVWNKEQGYAYITGNKGPEFQNLQPGDQVFNAQETKKILKRSKQNGAFPSFASGKYPSYAAHAYRGTTKSGASVGSTSKASSKASNTETEKTSDEWKNELDWLYNLMEDIAESERTQEKLATKHERYLKDFSKNGKDLYEITKLQIKNLDQQYKYQQQALAGREREMQEQIGQSGYTDYVWWNNNDRTIEINWDKIEAIQDKDTYDKVSELVSKAEDIQDKIDSAEDALLDIRGQMQELQQRYIQEYIDFEQRALQAVVNKYQTNIDELSELNDTLNNSNEAILKSIRQEIDLQRKIRDNTEAEKEISDMEARLAYLRRDTTGANQSQILALEKQLEEKRQSYSDNLVDQAIDRISEDNDKAAEQREHQIDLMTKQLEYWQKSGELWEEVHALMEGSIGVGYLLTTSDLVELIKENEGFRGMSKVQQEEFIRELEESFKNVLAFEETEEHPIYDPEENYMEGILERIQKEGADVWNSQTFKDAIAKRNEKYISEGWGTQEDLDIENAALRRLSSTEWKPYKKVNFDPNANYMDIMQKAVDKYGAGAVNTDEWKNAVAAQESKVYEQAKAKGEDPDAA